MYEIELKAHVKDSAKVVEILNKFATPKGRSFKRDTYYRIPSSVSATGFEKVRIRHEDGKSYLTFKQKTLVQEADGTSTEVNSEAECEINSTETLEKLFTALGATISFEKTKDVQHWLYKTGKFVAHCELCTVCNLGDFLEIEVMSEKKDDTIVDEIHALELEILAKCGIDKSEIEPKYYDQLLAENSVATGSY
ncbi:MAG: class IV adenylate cyclase [Treponemataceae bacterium]|nr:class IV adenylate cyclase [Treponemataceae bacterium]